MKIKYFQRRSTKLDIPYCLEEDKQIITDFIIPNESWYPVLAAQFCKGSMCTFYIWNFFSGFFFKNWYLYGFTFKFPVARPYQNQTWEPPGTMIHKHILWFCIKYSSFFVMQGWHQKGASKYPLVPPLVQSLIGYIERARIFRHLLSEVPVNHPGKSSFHQCVSFVKTKCVQGFIMMSLG